MAILAALFAFGSKFVGKILTTALGWASTLLFGRVPQSRQFLLLGITFGSVIWMVLLVGVLLPDVGTALLLFIPSQEIVPEGVIRLLMLLGAIVVPAVLGGLTLALAPATSRTARGTAEAILRGYPLTLLLAVLLVFLAGLAIWRKGWSLAKRWTDAHVPFVVKPGAYDQVADDLDRAVTAAGLEVEASEAPAVMSKPARWLAAVAGSTGGSLVPERLVQLKGQDLDILIYPMDLLISGKPELVARARAAMASKLTTSAAHLTVSAEAQAIEDRLAALMHAQGSDPDHPPRFDRGRRGPARGDRHGAGHARPAVRRVGGPLPPASPGGARPARRRDGGRGDPRGRWGRDVDGRAGRRCRRPGPSRGPGPCRRRGRGRGRHGR